MDGSVSVVANDSKRPAIIAGSLARRSKTAWTLEDVLLTVSRLA